MKLFLILILFLIFFIKVCLVKICYNSVSDKIRKGYKLKFLDSAMLIILIIGLFG